MKIVFIGGRDIHQLGGIENYMLNLASQLTKKGHEPIVFCESDHNGEEIINGFRVIYMKGLRSNILCKPWVSLKATLRTLLHFNNVDFVHYNAWPPSLWSPLTRLKGIKSLMQGHGLEWQRSKYSPKQQKIMRFMERLTAYTNQHLIMCSNDQTSYFKQHYGRTAVTIPTAINLPDLSNTPNSEILSKFKLTSKRYFLFMARLVKDKNPDILIKAFNQLKDIDYKLVIAGDNPAIPKYVSYLKELARGNPNIIFTGAVYGENKEQLLQNAYAFCLPSTIEGLSISLLEAMSYKLPIIASNIPANKEVLELDKAVWVIPEDIQSTIEAFQYCITNELNIISMVEANYIKVRDNYTWDKVTDLYIEYLSKI